MGEYAFEWMAKDIKALGDQSPAAYLKTEEGAQALRAAICVCRVNLFDGGMYKRSYDPVKLILQNRYVTLTLQEQRQQNMQ
ncbi:DUF2384 domain-containing protein [Paenibacillus polymyxa]|uniref:antitoxin Xre/MbcA/ParS toxin-binding domain-containing protein n=1 Tax=Paenibacillus polymyxa TaxID=1406 RepID=UPI001BEAC1C7|nr:DUF2384 domain-containing protein [Paenibacillus polymyxa]